MQAQNDVLVGAEDVMASTAHMPAKTDDFKKGIRCKIRSKLNKRVLDVSQSSNNGHEVGDLILYDWYEATNQQFLITNDGPDMIIKCVKSNKVLEVRDQSLEDGARIIESEYKGRPSQKWRIVQIKEGSGEFHIYSSNSGKVLDVPQEKAVNDAVIIQYEFNGNKNQVWCIRDLDKPK